MLWLPKRLRVEIRSRARDEAWCLLRDHGDEAEALLAAKLARRGLTAEFRLRYKLAAVELRKLRAARNGTGRAVVLYRSNRSGLLGLLRSFGARRTRKRS